MKKYRIRYSTYAIVEAENKEDALNKDCQSQLTDNMQVLEVGMLY
jgi:hypothetical protein